MPPSTVEVIFGVVVTVSVVQHYCTTNVHVHEYDVLLPQKRDLL